MWLMGVDAWIYVEGEVSDAEIARAEEFIAARLGDPDEWQKTWLARNGETLVSNGDEPPRVELNGWNRYYGPGYERGPWPTIYGQIRLMQALFPGRPCHYGGDTDWSAPEATDESLAAIWTHYLGPHGDDYRTQIRAWNERAREAGS